MAEIIRFRLLMIAAGYEDGNDADSLRFDPMFKMALDLTPSDRELCSQPTISRLENLPDVRALLRTGRAMVDLYCESYPQAPKRMVLDIDDTFDAVHGDQQLRLFNAHYDEYGFQPIVVFDGEGRFITAVLRPAKRPGGREIKGFLRRLLRAIRANWPTTEILLRGDSHYCAPEVLDVCRANGLDYILGVAPTVTLRRHIEGLEASTKTLYEAAPKNGKVRRFKEFYDGAASWSRTERIIARVEVGAEGPDTRFVVTNLKQRNARRLYEDVYCRRGQAENHIKSWKTHLAADRTSCTKATANQLRLFLHAGAYWIMWGLRVSMPKHSMWRVRTGTVVTYDDRNWELRWTQERRRFNLSRAIAVDMESATIATQGFRMRVPYGAMLCVSDKPLHGEIKLPGAANAFYERAIGEHLRIGLTALQCLQRSDAALHSRKLRSFDEPPFR